MADEKRLRTDSELLNGYSHFSDDQLVEFILRGNLHDWQKQQFERVLRLRRRKAYEDIAGIHNPPPLPPTGPTQSTEAAAEPQKPKKDTNAGCGCLILIAIAAVVIYFIVNSQ